MAVGVLLGDAFLPAPQMNGWSEVRWFFGLVASELFIESVLQWHHDHEILKTNDAQKNSGVFCNNERFGDFIILEMGFLLPPVFWLIQLGVATTLAIVLHEIPRNL